MAGSGRLRIAIASIYYAPEPTGIGPYSAAIAQHYAESGHAVHALTGHPHFPFWRRMKIPAPDDCGSNPRVSRFGHYIPKKPSTINRAVYEVSWLLSALRSVPRIRADAVIGITPTLSGAVLAWLAARRSKAPLGLVFQDLTGRAAGQSGYPGASAVASITGSVETFLARRAKGVVIITEAFRPYLESHRVEGIECIPNWVRPTPAVESVHETRRRFGFGSDEFICLYSGNMGHKQGLDNLLDTAELLHGTGIRIVLAGDGNDRARLVARCRDEPKNGVLFLDVQPPEVHGALLGAADVLLLSQRPTVSDMAMPSKLASYFAAGRPVVAAVSADSPASAEIELAHAGLTVPPGVPTKLAEALLTLKANPEECSVLGKNGLRYAEKSLTARSALASYDDFLRSLTGNN